MKSVILSPDEEKEAHRLLPPARFPGGLAPTGELVQGIRRRMARRTRRARVLRAVWGLAACAVMAAALVLASGRTGRGRGEAADHARAAGEEEAFREYEQVFGSDPNEDAFEELESLILALDFDFSTSDWQAL